jgi:hypothetical protein
MMPRAYSADMRMRVIARVEGGASRREEASRQAARREHLAVGGARGVFAGSARPAA